MKKEDLLSEANKILKQRRKPKPNTEQVDKIPGSRPRIYSGGTSGKPKDIDYF